MNSNGMANRWRPQRFDDVTGQSHVTTVLKRAVDRKRIAPAYLLEGPRGTGKTSTARIFGGAATCERPLGGDACDQCRTCEERATGGGQAIVEIDAASARSAEEARALRETIQETAYANERQLYVIDEAHMMTPQARDILRMTIEEAPAGTCVMLCTTESEALDDRLKARCQRHRFRRLRNTTISERLETIGQAEGLEYEDAGLRLIAHAAGGSMRDAVVLMDQVAAGAGGAVRAADVEETTGKHFRQRATVMVRHTLLQDAARALMALRETADEGAEPSQIHQQGREVLDDALAVAWGLTRASDLPQTTRVALQDMRWEGAIRMGRIWSEHWPRADARTTATLERAITLACEDGETTWRP